jgi:phosphohistidine phosphatase
MTELYLLRHAHAGDPMAWTAPDETRPLSEKGEKQAERLGKFLAGVGFEPDAIITSPKVRAARTAEIVAGHLGKPVAIDERLAGGLDLPTVDAIIHDAGDPERVVIVGHDPDFSHLLGELLEAHVLFTKKGAMARIDVERPLRAGTGSLAWLVPPELLKPAR